MFSSNIRASTLQRLNKMGMKRFCSTNNFETVFAFPSIKYIALLNRLKVYQLFGTSLIVPSCGVMEIANIVPSNTFLTASYLGLTGAAVLSLASFPFKNVIGFIYVSEDNKLIKISSVDFWGKRKDRIVKVDDWIPLLDMESKNMDAVYLTPCLRDGTKYKLFFRFGNVLNAAKMGDILE